MTRRLLPFIASAVGTAVLALIAPEIFSGTFSDIETFGRVALIVLVLVAWSLAIGRFVGSTVASRLLTIIPIAVVAALVLWPYLRPPTEVDEAFPIATTSATTTTTLQPDTSTTSATTTTITTTTTSTTMTTVPPKPVELRRSTFQGLTGHRGSGDAALYRLADQSILLRFEAVDIGSGPDLEVYVVPGDDQRSLVDAIHIAELTAERGNQNYALPDGVDLSEGTWTVLVWCETFDVEVANATLA